MGFGQAIGGMMRQSDIEFIVNSGDNKGKKYGFTLAIKDGEKQWAITPLFQPAPSIIKEKIEMILTTREANIPLSGAMELKAVGKILEQLRSIALETTASTLVGFDNKERLVQIDENGYSVASTILEPNREPEYLVNLSVWGLYNTT